MYGMLGGREGGREGGRVRESFIVGAWGGFIVWAPGGSVVRVEVGSVDGGWDMSGMGVG